MKLLVGRGELGYYIHNPQRRSTKECMSRTDVILAVQKAKAKGNEVEIMTGYQGDKDLIDIIKS